MSQVSIAAACIVAKVTRDRMCRIMHADSPLFGFDGHKGYATPEHLAALDQHGTCRHHRMDFAPCADAAARRAGLLVEAAESAGGFVSAGACCPWFEARRRLAPHHEVVLRRYSGHRPPEAGAQRPRRMATHPGE